MFRAFKSFWVLYAISLLMSVMNRAKTSVLSFFERFNSVLNEAASMLRIENDSSRTSRLSIIEVLVWVIEEGEVDCGQLGCFELKGTGKTEIGVFNWSEKTMTSFRISNNIPFLFIQGLPNMASWWSISAISIGTVNSLWLSMMRLSRILWVMIFLDIFPS